jgi:hypothetical protein
VESQVWKQKCSSSRRSPSVANFGRNFSSFSVNTTQHDRPPAMEHAWGPLLGDGFLSIPDLDAAPGTPPAPDAPPATDSLFPDPLFPDPLEALRRRRLCAEPPATWDPSGPPRALLEVPLLARGPGASSAPGPCRPGAAAECRALLAAAFRRSLGFDPPRALRALLAELARLSNYEILSVTRLQNPARHAMHCHFARVYDVDRPRRVYHGTTPARAAAIARHGFRTAASQRAKFGKGIYTAADPWEALAYAEPDPASQAQSLLVADLLQGPTSVGAADLADFGVDEQGTPVTTTTNAEGSIFCAAYEDQLYAHYLVTARFRLECLRDLSSAPCVRAFHPQLWKLIQAARSAEPPVVKPLFALKPPAQEATPLAVPESPEPAPTGATSKRQRCSAPCAAVRNALPRALIEPNPQ